MSLLPDGLYRALIHGLKKEGEWAYLHATVMPSGERVRLRLFDRQIREMIIALMHQPNLPTNMKGGQVRLHITLHPKFGNYISGIERIEPIPVESDVEIDRPVRYAEFDQL